MKEMNREMELNMNELEQVNGGGFCIGIGIGVDAAACWGEGSHAENDKFMEGTGAYACVLIGAGLGSTVEH